MEVNSLTVEEQLTQRWLTGKTLRMSSTDPDQNQHEKHVYLQPERDN